MYGSVYFKWDAVYASECQRNHGVRARGRAYAGYPQSAEAPALRSSREPVGVGLGLEEEHVDPHSYGRADKALQPQDGVFAFYEHLRGGPESVVLGCYFRKARVLK
jgi:hypothetical protein